MSWLGDQGAWLSRLVFERTLALIFLFAFVSALNQFRALLGSRGLMPIPAYLRATTFGQRPSVFHLYYADWFFAAVCWVGIVLSLATLSGLTAALPLWGYLTVTALTWASYLSIVNVGQRWYSFGWEMLLCEVGFFAIFLGPAELEPPTLVLWMMLWLLFRVEFGAGMIKMRGDACWRDLTCLYYHHQTQPMPGPLSWYFHHLPKPLHRVEVAANHVVQLVVPFALFAPDPVRTVAAVLIILTQLWLMLSGNFAWLNALTIAVALTAVDSRVLRVALPLEQPSMQSLPTSYSVAVMVLAVLVLALSWHPARNLFAPKGRQKMNYSWNPLYICSAYGAFGSVGRVRREIVIEGTSDRRITAQTQWLEYEFRGKPGDVRRRPRQFAPYHLRLDWLLWFLALSPVYGKGWFDLMLVKLLLGDRDLLRHVRRDPFADDPPVYVRSSLYSYRFTTPTERRATGDWWVRERLGTHTKPRRLRTASDLDG